MSLSKIPSGQPAALSAMDTYTCPFPGCSNIEFTHILFCSMHMYDALGVNLSTHRPCRSLLTGCFPAQGSLMAPSRVAIVSRSHFHHHHKCLYKTAWNCLGHARVCTITSPASHLKPLHETRLQTQDTQTHRHNNKNKPNLLKIRCSCANSILSIPCRRVGCSADGY